MDLIGALLDLCKTVDRPIIAIDGPAGAGKTTLASNLQLVLYPQHTARVIHMDDLYDGWDNALTEHLSDVLISITTSHRAGKEISYSPYDWLQRSFLPPQTFPSTDILILEGVGSGQRAIRNSLTALIWMEIDIASGFERVVQRDGELIKDEMKKWLRTQEQHFSVEGTDKAADFVLTT